MERRDKAAFRRILATQMERYPRLQVQDLYKLIHQAAMGSEHAARDEAAARQWLESELSRLGDGPEEPEVESISPDGAIVRVHLRPYAASGGDPLRLLAAFLGTARKYKGDESRLRRYWDCAEEMCRSGELPFREEELRRFFADMKGQGYPAVHHSKEYAEAYRPAYRVVARAFLTEEQSAPG